MSCPFRSLSHRRLPAIRFRGRSRNSVAERCPDWTAVGFRFPRRPRSCPVSATAFADASGFTLAFAAVGRAIRTSAPGPVPRITRPSPVVPDGYDALGPTCHRSGEFLPAGLHATGGDSNPTRLRAPVRPLVPGGLIAGRRLPPCPHLVASHGRSLRKSVSVTGAFSNFAGRFHRSEEHTSELQSQR